ncbi:2752_t:CDS:2, partial [Entrophospora sp. SA101]
DGEPCGMKFLFEHTKGSTSNTLHHLQNDHNLLRPELSKKWVGNDQFTENQQINSQRSSLNPHFQIPSLFTIRQMMAVATNNVNEKLMHKIIDSCRFCCLTTDFWTSIDNKGYIGITCSWLEDFEPVEVLLNLLYVPHPHTGLKINDNIEILILRARRLILFFKSPKQWERLGEVQRQLNYPHILKPILDVKTRWNSTYKAWVHLLDLRDAIKELINRMQFESDRDTKYDAKRLKKIMLNHQEWTLIKELVLILKDFNDITTTLSGNSFVTLSLVYPAISHLIKKLQLQISDNNDNFESFDEFIPPANSNTEEIEILEELSNGERHKRRLRISVPINTANLKDKVIKALRSTIALTHQNPLQKTIFDDLFDVPQQQEEDELTKYLNMSNVAGNVDPLGWWKDRQNELPMLAILAN